MFPNEKMLRNTAKKYKSRQDMASFINNRMEGTCNTRINEEGMEIICTHKYDGINRMKLSQNQIGPQAILRFIEGKWDRLSYLYLHYNKIGDNGCQYLSRAQLKCLFELTLSHNQISGVGALHLSKSQWKRFKRLNLNQNHINDFGFLMMLLRANWVLFEQIGLLYNQINQRLFLLSNHPMKYIFLHKYWNENFIPNQKSYTTFLKNKFGEKFNS